jgi:hypothetical protein
VCILSIVLYFFWLKGLARAAYQGHAPVWFVALVEAFYPRFAVEKQRFDLLFFLNKADQVILRLNLVLLLSALVMSLRQQTFMRRLKLRLFNVRKDKRSLQLLLLIFYTGYLSYVSVWYEDLALIARLVPFYKPISVYQLFNIPLPSVEFLHTVFFIMMLSGVLVILHIRPFFASVVNALSFLFLQGYFYCFEKIDHRFATLTIAVMLMPFLVHILLKSRQYRTFNAWPLQLIRFGIAMTYLLAGLEKLFTSGFSWASAETFRTYVFLHQAPLGLQLAESDFLAHLLPFLGILFQIGFICILFFPTYRLWFILSGIAFHIGTVLLLNVGDFMNPWIFMYIFFIDWRWLRHRARRVLSMEK